MCYKYSKIGHYAKDCLWRAHIATKVIKAAPAKEEDKASKDIYLDNSENKLL